MTVISDPAARDELLALNDRYEVAVEAASAADADVREAAGRAQSLRGTIAEHNAAEPADDPDVSAELSDLLAANPAAAASADWTGKLMAAQEAQAAARAAWKGKGTVLAQALAQVQGEHAERVAAAARAAERRSAAYSLFATTARTSMMSEMRPRWEAFVRETIMPMAALSQVGGSGPRSIVNFNGNGVAIISVPGGAVSEWLYKAEPMMPHAALAAVEGFRTTLTADAAPAAEPKARARR